MDPPAIPVAAAVPVERMLVPNMPPFQVMDMVVGWGKQGQTQESISFKVMGMPQSYLAPTIQWINEGNELGNNHLQQVQPSIFYPHQEGLDAFDVAVRAEMEDMHCTFPFFTDATSPKGLVMTAKFLFQRPAAHYTSNNMDVEADAPPYPKRKELANLGKFVIESLTHHGTMFDIPMVTKTNSMKAYNPGPGYTELSFTKYT